LSSRQVASALGISFKTVVSHRSHLMEKLGVHNIAGLMHYAIRAQLISESEFPPD
jgi:DNA-binding CsgD family transcriptional regulator